MPLRDSLALSSVFSTREAVAPTSPLRGWTWELPTASTPGKKFSVPMSNQPVEPLIQKAKPSLKAQAKAEGKRLLRLKTLRHSDCKEVGKDLFDDIVSDFLNGIGEDNLISITPINYSYVEMGTQKLINDFGLAILYRE